MFFGYSAGQVAKALVAGVLAFIGAVITGLSDSVMEAIEWWIAVGALVTALGTVFGVPNAPHNPERIDSDVIG